MKKFLAIVLALTFVLSLGVFSFAADEVTGTLADGTAITKPVSEVVKSVEDGLAGLDAEKAEALKAFFADAEADEGTEVIAKGIVDFGGAFAEATEAEIEVPLPVAGAKAGEKVGVSLSNGTSKTVEPTEDGVVPVAFPKDADGIGYVVSSKEESTWDWPLPAEPAPGKSWDRVRTEDTPYGPITIYENLDENGNPVEQYATGTLTFEDGSTQTITENWSKDENGKETYTAEYTMKDKDGNPTGHTTVTGTRNPDGSGTEESNGTGTTPDGGTYVDHSTTTYNPDGSSVTEYTSTTTTPSGETLDYSETTTVNPDGSYTIERTLPDGTTETHSYDKDGNEILPSNSPEEPEQPSTEDTGNG